MSLIYTLKCNFCSMKTIGSILIALFFIGPLAAQPGQKGERLKERIRAERVAFLSERLELTTDEAQKFWPIYNEHDAKMSALKKEQRASRKAIDQNLNQLSDKELEAKFNEDFQRQQQMLDFQKKLITDITRSFGAKKAALMIKAEHDFKLQLVKRMKERGQPMPDDND
jgi:hypothetical protein